MSSATAPPPSASATATATATAPPSNGDPSTSSNSTRGPSRQRNRRGRGGGGGAKGGVQQQIGQLQQGEAASAPAISNASASGRGGRGARGARGGTGGRGAGSSRGGRGGGRAAVAQATASAQGGDQTATSNAGAEQPPPTSTLTSNHRQQRSRNPSRSRQPPSSSTEPSSSSTADPTSSAAEPKRPSGRRSKFNASLSLTSSTTLQPTASSFTPTPSLPSSTHPSPAPVSQTLLQRLTQELTNGTSECSICVSEISRTARIHSCATCSTPFHLSCIKEWATRSVDESAERARLLATSASATPPDQQTMQGSWRCPSCQTPSLGPNSIPKKYTCYCLRLLDPPPPSRSSSSNAIPHSCNQPCAKPRPEGCTHGTCGLKCHPGPCPPCSVVLEKGCHCGKEGKRVRCSALFPPRGVVGPSREEKERLLSCGKGCAGLLECGLHRCGRTCHEGACGGCEQVRGKRCYCGGRTREEGCGEGVGERVEGCRKVVEGEGEKDEKSEEWVGEWSCENVCGAPYSCSHHSCPLPCHPHTSPLPQPCPFSPSSITTCPCAQTPLTSLLPSPRLSCSDPIPTCSLPCPSILPCGHTCPSSCHAGEHSPCEERVTITCRCGQATTSRVCSAALAEEGEFQCGRVCKAMRTCGRHQCNRVCCPLSYQEALQTKSSKRRGGGGGGGGEWQTEEDPLGVHQCERICGRKLNCGVHYCERRDHKGACGNCLRADFDELVCNCGSTVILPPIPCSYTIDCRHPCTRPSPCGHQTMPHACHEDPVPCPPCPFLVEKECACGKKRVGNVRCSLGREKVSCGTVCGKLLRCGFHRCRRSCHPSGACESCDQTCLKPLRLCTHPCPSPCHSPTSCPTDAPCPKLITVSCACGHLQQSARCGACDAKPEGNTGRLLKCGDACAQAKRSKMLAEALGVEKREPRSREVEYEPLMLSFYGANVAWCNSIEAQLAEFVKSDKPSLHFPVMKRPQRAFTHELAELFDLRSESLDEEPRRSVVVHRQSNSAIPVPTLSDALTAQRKSASTTLTFGSLRKPEKPEKKASNAIYLEGVLGFDEAMLKDILRPLTRGLVFSCTWVGEEDVLVTFDTSLPEILDPKLPLMINSFRTLASDTGFCATVEPVHLSPEDGKITRGAWTPVASSSRSNGGNSSWRNGASQTVFTPNAFATLGGGGGVQSAPTPARSVWGASGGVVGPAAYKPPRAVIAPVASRERPLPPHNGSTTTPANGSARIPSPAPEDAPVRVQNEEDVPDSWDAESQQ